MKGSQVIDGEGHLETVDRYAALTQDETRVVDQHVETIRRAQHGVGEALDLLERRQIGQQERYPGASGAPPYLLDGGGAPRRVACGGKHVGTATSEVDGGPLSDAGVGAGDQGDLALQRGLRR